MVVHHFPAWDLPSFRGRLQQNPAQYVLLAVEHLSERSAAACLFATLLWAADRRVEVMCLAK